MANGDICAYCHIGVRRNGYKEGAPVVGKISSHATWITMALLSDLSATVPLHAMLPICAGCLEFYVTLHLASPDHVTFDDAALEIVNMLRIMEE